MKGTDEMARILIVEDEVVVTKVLSLKLKDLGYEVAGIVNNAIDAIAEAKRLKPDLILMDIMLKGDMDGIEAAGEIRKSSDVPVIFLTAFSDEDTLSRAKITSPFGYVIKPFEEREIRISIEIALYKHKMDEELKAARREIRVLNGLLPICASCKKIRDDKGYWSQLEVYIKEHSNAEFTHGYCPECAGELLDGLKKD